MLTPEMIAQMIPEDIGDTYMVLKESGGGASGVLWHRRQQSGVKFQDDTPLNIVLDFIRDADRATRYDLQTFLDRLQGCIDAQATEMYDEAIGTMVRIHQEAGGHEGDGDDRVEWLDGKLNDVRDVLLRVVPVIRRSQAQAKSLEHARALLQRHRERLVVALQNVEQEAPQGIDEIMDGVHTVAGGILEACDVIGAEILPRIW